MQLRRNVRESQEKSEQKKVVEVEKLPKDVAAKEMDVLLATFLTIRVDKEPKLEATKPVIKNQKMQEIGDWNNEWMQKEQEQERKEIGSEATSLGEEK